jgi:hypothetical protein
VWNELSTHEDASSETEAFDIQIDVPYGNAMCDLKWKSNIQFSDLLADIAEKMGTKGLALCIGYMLLFWPRTPKPKPRLLNDEDSWKNLLQNVLLWIETEK